MGVTPEALSSGIFSIIRNVPEPIIIPITGLVLTFIVYYELIQMVIDYDNLNSLETWILFKWIFKTFTVVALITNTFNITMVISDITNYTIEAGGGTTAGDTAIDLETLDALEETLMEIRVGPPLSLFLQLLIVQITMSVLSIVIFTIICGKTIEIYLVASLASTPLSISGNKEQSQVEQNYLRSLSILGLQGFLIMICVGIYAVLISELTLSDDIIMSIWGIMDYTVLLRFTLLRTESLAKSVLNAH